MEGRLEDGAFGQYDGKTNRALGLGKHERLEDGI